MEHLVRLLDHIGRARIAAIPVTALLFHGILHWNLTRFKLMPSRLVHLVLWAGMSIGLTCVWLHTFWDLMPMGKITPKLIQGDFGLCMHHATMWFIIAGAMLIYYLVSFGFATSVPLFSTTCYLRKSVVLLVMFVYGNDPSTLVPSQGIGALSWLLRYIVVDALIDLVSICYVLRDDDTTGIASFILAAIKVAAIYMYSLIFFDSLELLSKFPFPALFLLLIGPVLELNPFVK